MKKKLVSVLLCAAMVMGMTAGCGKDSSEAEPEQQTAGGDGTAKIRMTYWNSEDTVKSLLEYLKEEVPDVEIEFQFIDNSNYDTVVDTQLSAEEGPDIICESPASALKHAKLGYLAEVNDLGAKYSDAGTSVYSYDGNIYALPGISWFEGIYYNMNQCRGLSGLQLNHILEPSTDNRPVA